MTTLIFKNEKLQGILKLTEAATNFAATFSETVAAYEKGTGEKYDFQQNLEKYAVHNIPTLWLVKDEGIYLMSPAKTDRPKGDKSHICYAEGFEPSLPNSFDKCRTAVGGDDFVESFEFTDALQSGIKRGADIQIDISEQSFTVCLIVQD